MISMINTHKKQQIKIQFLGTAEDEPFLFHLTNALGPYKSGAGANLRKFDFISEIIATYASKGITHIITTQEQLIPMLCSTASAKEQKLNNYSGSWITHNSGMHFLFINPLKQCTTITYGKFLLERYISKITKPETWVQTDKFNWEILNETTYEQCLRDCIDAAFIGIDIETRPDLSISSVSYTCVFIDDLGLAGIQKGSGAKNQAAIKTKTWVMPLPYGLEEDDYEIRFAYIAKYNDTPTTKVLQNGKYDNAYFNYYGCPVRSYLFDTAVCHHAWLSELPKDLGTLGAFYIRKALFWKHEGDSGNDYDLYQYNALDTWNTVWVFIAWLLEAPTWARKNYLIEFPVIHANFLSECTGLAVNLDAFNRVLEVETAKKEKAQQEVRDNLGEPLFNPGSSQQTKKVMDILGCSNLKNADEKAMKRAAFQHPLNHFIIDRIIKYRKAAKLVSTYLNKDKFFIGANGISRVLYSISPTTDTGRNASREHALWTGFNIQNIPRQGGIKSYLEADEGFLLGEADYAQAESRDTGYITGDMVLINAVESDKDFHKNNASMFFGVPYEEVDKELRQLGKPVNHGCNYLMSDDTLVDSMGLENVFKAAKRLLLPKLWDARHITKHLIKLFAATYKVVAHDYPRWIQQTVKTTGHLVNPYGWTRRCFGDPIKDRGCLRALVAHLPQGTNGQALNKAYVRVFNEVWKDHSDNFKLCAQVHDSILFQYRIGHEYLADEVKRIMEESSVVEVTDIKGVTRTLRVPVDVSIGGKSWQDSKD